MATATKKSRAKSRESKAKPNDAPPFDSGRWICNVCNTARPAGQGRCDACGNAEFRLEMPGSPPDATKSKATPTTHNKPNGEPCDWVERMLAGSEDEARRTTHDAPVVTREIDVDLIEPSPFQPRTDFGDEDLSDLASIGCDSDGRATGLIHAIRVRPVGAGYELIDGERRLRRAKRVGCRTIRCEVSEMTDDEADEAVLVANEAAKAFTPVERARWIRAHRERTGQSQAETGRKLGHDQSWVSAHESLLKLPEPVQALVMSGDIPLHSAKQLFGVAAYPEICIAAAKACKAKDGTPAGPGDVQVALVAAAKKHAREIHDHYDRKSRRCVKALKLTPALREELGVITLRGRYGGNCDFATNATRYDELVREAEAKLQAREEKREAAAKAKKKQAGKDPSKLSPAARKKLAEEEKQKREEAAAKFAKRLWGFHVDWNRYAIAQELRSGHVPYETCLRLLLDAAACWEHKRWTPDGTERFPAKSLLAGLILDAGGKVPGRNGEENLWVGLETVPDAEVETVAERYLAGYFYTDAGGPCRIVPDDRVLRIADWLDVDLGVLWADEQCGPLSDEYWGLHNKEQLEELARELNVSLAGRGKRADMIQAFLDTKPGDEDDANTAASKALPMPKELVKVKRPK